eukprot:m.803138 g.803138  ORF g.803138 m.803138 type:complete len:449 (+) comp23364_c0_seq29:2522-3868(+)
MFPSLLWLRLLCCAMQAKPETWAVQNIYATVVVHGQGTGFVVDNRHDITDLSNVSFTWALLDGSGVRGSGSASGGPHTTGNTLALHGYTPVDGVGVEINATSPRGYVINIWHFGESKPTAPTAMLLKGKVSTDTIHVTKAPDGSLTIVPTGGAAQWRMSADGELSATILEAAAVNADDFSAKSADNVLMQGGPALLAVDITNSGPQQLSETNDRNYGPPLTDTLPGWSSAGPASYTLVDADTAALVNVSGTYSDTATVHFLYRFNGTGTIDLTYTLTWHGPKMSPRQIGVVFDLPSTVSKLSWARKGQWSYYPQNMIGRPVGTDVEPRTCTSLFDACPHGAAVPANEWKDDTNTLGTNDFRSTKANFTHYMLCNNADMCVGMTSAAEHHGRSWMHVCSLAKQATTVAYCSTAAIAQHDYRCWMRTVCAVYGYPQTTRHHRLLYIAWMS